MVTVEEALKCIEACAMPLQSEEISLEDVHGQVLDENIVADRDFPPYNRSAMDGIAIACDPSNTNSFKITGEQVAGAAQQTLSGEHTCFEIMTGASVPIGADAVVRYEDVKISDGEATITIEGIKPHQNIHKKGADAKTGDVLIPQGEKINSGDIGILASVGKTMIRVKKLPKVALVSTGDELVEPSETPLDHQVRKSNIYSLLSELKKEELDVEKFHFDDTYDELKKGLNEIIEKYDVLLMSGGVSKGKRDFIPDVLEEIGVKKHFHRIAQKPGKPMWFGQNDQVTVFGFPGNPVSTLVCYILYFKRWLNISLGIKPVELMAELKEDIHFKPDLVYHIPVAISHTENRVLATPFLGHGSGDLVNLSKADGFLTLPRGKDHFLKGEIYQISF
ncbi:MAG: molybdopterin molybdotransferase MoeA [Cytophagales bacterium]|nr:molybdopterin molybdotransferase MoeA [Cytophagales bacterium]